MNLLAYYSVAFRIVWLFLF